MERLDVYSDIAKRTGGDIYLGVVGPVRTGKSTFITKFMDNFLVPNISDKLLKQIPPDEMPHSAHGKTTITTQIKFMPANAVKVKFKNKLTASVRLVDCVGYFTEGATGHLEDGKPRLVKTPWSKEEIPFEKVAEIGTKKVITDYSTIGILMTSDGSFGEIPRESFAKTEEKVARELFDCNKPFIIVLNTAKPSDSKTLKLCEELEEKYGVAVIAVDVLNITDEDIANVMEKVLFEFPMNGIKINMPDWMQSLPVDSKIISKTIEVIKESSSKINKMKDFTCLLDAFNESEEFDGLTLSELSLANGFGEYTLKVKDGLFYKILSEESGEQISGEYDLMNYFKGFVKEKRKFDLVKEALVEAEENGYGVVLPTSSDMSLEQPVLVKKKGGYGVKLKATAPSLHIMKVDVETEVSPIVGNQKQGEDMVNYIMERFEENPNGVLDTNMFGKSLEDIVGEGIYSKANGMQDTVKKKMRRTVNRIVNEGKGGVICILL